MTMCIPVAEGYCKAPETEYFHKHIDCFKFVQPRSPRYLRVELGMVASERCGKTFSILIIQEKKKTEQH